MNFSCTLILVLLTVHQFGSSAAATCSCSMLKCSSGCSKSLVNSACFFVSDCQITTTTSTATSTTTTSKPTSVYTSNLVYYWPVWNGDSVDMVTGQAMTSPQPLFDTDRYGNANSALRISNASNYWMAEADTYFSPVSSITGWFKPVTFGTWTRIFDFGNGGFNYSVVFCYSIASNNQNPIMVILNNPSTVYYGPTPNTIGANQWYHFAIVANNYNIKVYLNGVQNLNDTMSVTMINVTRTENYFGKSFSSADDYANIFLDEVKIFNVALDEQQVIDDMNMNMTDLSYQPLNISISCRSVDLCVATGSYKRVSESSDLILVGDCDNGCQNAISLDYSWHVYVNSGTETKPNWSRLTTVQLSYLSGASTSELAIKSSLFSSTSSVYFMVSLGIKAGFGGSSFKRYSNSIILKVNKVPYGGSCSISPTTGVALLTQFSIACPGWTDDSGNVAKYEYFIWSLANPHMMSIGYETTGSFTAALPTGQSNNSYELYMTVQLYDIFNSIASYQISTPVVVYPNSSFLVGTIQNVLNSVTSDTLVQMIQSPDLTTVTSTVVSIASSVNDAVDQNQLTSQEISLVLKLNERIANILATFASTSDLSDIKAISSALSVVSTNLDLINSNTALKIGSICSILTASLADASSGYGLDQINQVTGNLLAAVTNALQSLNQDYVTYSQSSQSQQTSQLYSANAFAKTVINDITNVVSNQLTYGSSTTLSGPKVDLKISRDYATNADSSLSIGGCDISIPDTCDMLGLTSSSCSSTGIIQQTFTMPYALIGTNGNQQVNVVESKSVSLAFYSDTSQQEMSVSSYQDGISFWIGKSLDSVPSFEAVSIVNSSGISSANQIRTFGVTLSSPDQALTIDLMPNNTQAAYFILIMFGQLPVVNSSQQNYDLIKVHCPMDIKTETETGNEFYSLFVSSSTNTNQVVNIGYGFRELTQQEKTDYCSGPSSLTPSEIPLLADDYDFSQVLSYSLWQRVYASGCYYLDETTVSWSSYGTEVLSDSTITSTHCIAYHLTEYAGGLVVLPPQIDFNNVWANASFTKNLTIYLTVIIISSLYILLMIICRYMDWKDEKKRAVFVLADNLFIDQYFYELIVFTGGRNEAGTESKVSFILAGSDSETNERKLVPLSEKGKRERILQRGSAQSFIMATPGSLGKELRHIKIWHDNSGEGSKASWFLKFIIVHDLQTRDKFYFICQDWLAVDKSDGSLTRILPVATRRQKTDLAYLMEKQTKEKMSEGHLWFSIWARPVTSSFARVDRLTCAFVLLCITMLVNIMYYEQSSSSSSSNELVLGPFSFSQTQIVVGVISNLLIFPPSFLLLQIFRKSRRRSTKSTQIRKNLDKLIDKKNDSYDYPGEMSLEEQPKPNYNKQSKSKKKKPFSLPWWFKIIGYVLSACFVAICIFFIIVKGISFGDSLCRKWLTAFLISILTSVFFTQPVQVALLAMFFVLLFRKSDDTADLEEDHFDDGRSFNPSYQSQQRTNNEEKPITIDDQFNNEHIKILRKKREMENKVWSLMKRLLIYSMFLSVLFCVAYSKTNYRSYNYQMQLQNLFVHNISLIKTPESMWRWMRNEFLYSISATKLYNQESLSLSKYAGDYTSYLVGVVQLRQARVVARSCSRVVGSNVCTFDYGVSNADSDNYYLSWSSSAGSSSLSSSLQNAFKYTSAFSIDSQPYAGTYTSYLGGGYVYQFDPSVSNTSQIQQDLSELEENDWVDQKTRAFFIEFTLYNVNLDLFCYSVILFEYLPTGNIVSSYVFYPISLYADESVVYVALDIIYLFIMVFFMLNEFKLMIKLKWAYLKQWWSYLNWTLIAFSWTAFAIYLNRLYEKYSLMKKLNENSNQLINFQTITYWNQLMLLFLGFCCYLASFKTLQLMSFSRSVTYIFRVFNKCIEELAAFVLVYIILLMAFTQMMYLMVYDQNSQFMSFATSLVTGFLMLIGKFNVDSFCEDTGSIVGPLVYCTFAVVMIMILLNMFITILTSEFSRIRSEYLEEHQGEDSLVLMYLKGRLWPSIKSLVPKLDRITKSNKSDRYKNQVAYVESLDSLDSKVTQLTHYAYKTND